VVVGHALFEPGALVPLPVTDRSSGGNRSTRGNATDRCAQGGRRRCSSSHSTPPSEGRSIVRVPGDPRWGRSQPPCLVNVRLRDTLVPVWEQLGASCRPLPDRRFTTLSADPLLPLRHLVAALGRAATTDRPSAGSVRPFRGEGPGAVVRRSSATSTRLGLNSAGEWTIDRCGAWPCTCDRGSKLALLGDLWICLMPVATDRRAGAGMGGLGREY
jgi:hypothetical protein